MIERAASLSFPGVVHGFTNRLGGVSTGKFASLNLGRKWGDATERVDENFRRVAAGGGYAPGSLRMVRQVHRADVVAWSAVDDATEADALWCRRADNGGAAVVGVRTADCVPVLLVDEDATVAAAVHSGWRGTVLDIVGETVRTLAREGVAPGRLRAAIGPCIEQDAFEVGPEVAEQFPDAFVATAGYKKPHVDLVAMIRAQLARAGVAEERVERVGGCTHADPARYFSYRRDGAGTGQQLSFIGFAATPA